MPDQHLWQHSGFPAPGIEELNEPLPRSLARVAGLWPDQPAVFAANQAHSFRALLARAAGMAAEIQETAVGSGPVALIQPAGFDAVAAWFACALAGRPLLLLEPDHPAARLQELIDQASCSLALCGPANAQAVEKMERVVCRVTDGRDGVLSLEGVLPADAPAMIFPTSGSTGTPKLVTHSAITLQARLRSSARMMGVSQGARVLIGGTHGNFGFVHHALVFLLSGGVLCFADVKAGGFAEVLKAIRDWGARHVRFTPSMFRQFAALPEAREALGCLHALRFSGEPLLQADLALAKSVLDPQCVVHNVYGSTESALFIDRCAGPGTPAPAVDVGPTVPMGHIYPLFSYAIQPLEPDDEARGTGELVIGSAFHALGDYRAGRVDAGRFTSCAGHDATGRVYRTGDIVRRLPDGRLVHLGRTGRMLKIRGQRVFLDEVEHHLRAMPGVTAAVVVARPERDGPVLYGFVCRGGRTGPEPAALEWLAARLPLFMRPRNVMAVAQMPLLAGGKVDHHALLAQVTSPTARPGPVAAGSSESARLAALWDGVLWEGAHRHEADFAALGGDSLKLMTLALQVERQFGLAFPMDPFLAEGTFARLAALLDMEGVLPAGPVAPPKTPEVLNIHRVWPARQTSAGIALAMPGWGGKAVVTPFGQGGLFPDHELWAADFPLRGGTMGVDHRWWRAAQQIVQKINAGEWEPPQLIFGYSFGGSLAWLVGRLLAGSPHCPQRVIMVDAAPLHRLPAFQHPACQHALAAVADRPPPPVLHLHRAHLPKLGLCDGWHQNLWDPADQLQCQFGLPTIDHAEMVHPQVLALAAETVSRFIAGRDMPRTSSGAMARPVLPGVLLHDALRGDPVSPRSTVQGAVDFATHAGSIDYCLALLHLHGESSTARELHEMIRAAVDATPASRMLQYIKRRLHRSHAMLCPQDLPRALPFEIGAIERTLALRLSKDSPQALPKPRSRLARQLGLAQDIAAAAAAAGWARMRRTLRQWRGS